MTFTFQHDDRGYRIGCNMCYSRICAVASHVAGFMLNPLSTGCLVDGRITYLLQRDNQTNKKTGEDMFYGVRHATLNQKKVQ